MCDCSTEHFICHRFVSATIGRTAVTSVAMSDDQQVYAEWVEPRSFECKKCRYTSTNRRVVEQHLRQSHADLFAGADLPPELPRGSTGFPVAAPADFGEGQRVRPAHPITGDVVFYTDAGTWDNGTKRQRSVLAVWDSREQGIVVHDDLPGTTNNEAEYAAIIEALELARHEGLRDILIRSDSQLCVKQIKGEYQVKEERLRPLRDRAARILKDVRGRIEWVPRELNHAGIFLEKKYKH